MRVSGVTSLLFPGWTSTTPVTRPIAPWTDKEKRIEEGAPAMPMSPVLDRPSSLLPTVPLRAGHPALESSSVMTDDEVLLGRLRAGDESAFVQLVERYQASM